MLYQLSYSRILHYLGREGFEPPKHYATDLQSAPFSHSGISPKAHLRLLSAFERSILELARGIEPPTCRLQGGCSTLELRQPNLLESA